MSVKSENILKTVETYTHYNYNGGPMEVFLVGVNADQIGIDNEFEPDNFGRHHISTWMRKRYYFLDGIVYAQVPRRSKHYPEESKNQLEFEDSFATDVTEGHNGDINIYYPISNSRCLRTTWDVFNDYWSMEEVKKPNDGDNVISEEGDSVDSEVVWSIR